MHLLKSCVELEDKATFLNIQSRRIFPDLTILLKKVLAFMAWMMWSVLISNLPLHADMLDGGKPVEQLHNEVESEISILF